MSNWNEGYTLRKQKQMVAEQIKKDKVKKSPSPLKPLYREFGGQQSESFQSRRAEELRIDKFAWRVGYCVCAIIIIIGSYVIYWASTLH